MNRYKELYYLLGVVVLLCIIVIIINAVFRERYSQAFVQNESFVEKGKGKLQYSAEELYTYRIDSEDNTLMIVHFQGHYLEDKIEDLVVEDTIDGYKVTVIEEGAFSWDEKLETITFPNTIEEIRNYACANLPNLREIRCAGENLIEIKEDAFPDFTGTIVTTRNSKLWEYALEHGIDVKECRE